MITKEDYFTPKSDLTHMDIFLQLLKERDNLLERNKELEQALAIEKKQHENAGIEFTKETNRLREQIMRMETRG